MLTSPGRCCGCCVGLTSSRGASVTHVFGRCCVCVLSAAVGLFGAVSSAVAVVRVPCNGWVVAVDSSDMSPSQSTSVYPGVVVFAPCCLGLCNPVVCAFVMGPSGSLSVSVVPRPCCIAGSDLGSLSCASAPVLRSATTVSAANDTDLVPLDSLLVLGSPSPCCRVFNGVWAPLWYPWSDPVRMIGDVRVTGGCWWVVVTGMVPGWGLNGMMVVLPL